MEKKDLENKKNNQKFKNKKLTIVLFVVALALVIFYLTLPSKKYVKEVKIKDSNQVKQNILKEEKTSEEILREDLNNILNKYLNKDTKILKIYFSENTLYLETNKKIEDNLIIEKLLSKTKENFSIKKLIIIGK